MIKIKDKFPVLLAIAFSAYGLYLRLLELSARELWADEYYTLGTMGGSFIDMLKAIPKHECGSYINGALYLIYPFFKTFGHNKWGLAIPLIIATVLGFCFLYMICRMYFKTFMGYLVTFSMVCFNATMIFHATEIRWYGVLPTLSLGSFYFADMLINKFDSLNIRQKILIALFFIFVSWFHLYGVLMVYLSVAFFLFSKPLDKIIFRKIFKFMMIVSAVIAPLWLVSALGPRLVFKADPFMYIPDPLVDTIGFLKSIFGNLVGNRMLYILLPGLFFPFLMWSRSGRRQATFMFTMVILPIVVIFIIDVINVFYFLQRQFIWVMPLFAFFLGWAWDSFFISLKERWYKR